MSVKTIPQKHPVLFQAPQVGHPFNFNNLLSGVMIPRAVIEFPGLAPGAKLLWGTIRALSRNNGVCWARCSVLADRLNCSARQVSRYRSQLVRAELMRVQDRPGDTWGCVLIWHICFSLLDSESQDTSGVGSRQIRRGVTPHLSAPSKEIVLPASNRSRTEHPSSSEVQVVAEQLQIDDDAAGMLLWNSRKVEPSVTASEVVMLAREKLIQTNGKARNWVGLILTAVPKMAKGKTLESIRRKIAHQQLAKIAEQNQLRDLAEEILKPGSLSYDDKPWSAIDIAWARQVVAKA